MCGNGGAILNLSKDAIEFCENLFILPHTYKSTFIGYTSDPAIYN